MSKEILYLDARAVQTIVEALEDASEALVWIEDGKIRVKGNGDIPVWTRPVGTEHNS